MFKFIFSVLIILNAGFLIAQDSEISVYGEWFVNIEKTANSYPAWVHQDLENFKGIEVHFGNGQGAQVASGEKSEFPYEIISSSNNGFTTRVVTNGKETVVKWYYDGVYIYNHPIPGNQTRRLYFAKSE